MDFLSVFFPAGQHVFVWQQKPFWESHNGCLKDDVISCSGCSPAQNVFFRKVTAANRNLMWLHKPCCWCEPRPLPKALWWQRSRVVSPQAVDQLLGDNVCTECLTKWFLSTRLETRTKESNVRASVMVSKTMAHNESEIWEMSGRCFIVFSGVFFEGGKHDCAS